jgi:hypothetical protein
LILFLPTLSETMSCLKKRWWQPQYTAMRRALSKHSQQSMS